MRPAGRIVHRTRGRIRLRVPERRRDLAWFLLLYEHLRRLPGVNEVQADPITASALLRIEDGQEERVARALAYSPLFTLEDGEPAPALAAATGALHAARTADRSLRERTGGILDLRALALLIAVGLTLRRPIAGALITGALSILLLPLQAANADGPGAAEASSPIDHR